MIYFACFATVIGALFIVYMMKEAFANRIVYQELSFAEFPKSFGEVKIFFISDVHRRNISNVLLTEVEIAQPDIIIIGGDLMEKGVPFKRVEKNLRQLKRIADVYFVWGNNDYEVDYHKLDCLLLDCGVKILDNTAISFESAEGDRFILLGTDEISEAKDRLDLALSDAVEADFKLLVSHNPSITNKITKEDQIQLVLSGHTHGGQIHFLGYSPYEKGTLEVLPQTTILISNGYGTTALPFRLGAKVETHLITLKNAQNEH